MYARLYAKSGPLAGKSYDIVAEAIIGHGPECNLVIKSGIISAKHARIFYDQKKGSYFLEDFKTLNGTLLDGKPVQGRVKLEKKHVVIIANTFAFIFQVESGQAADPLPPPPRDLPPEPEIPPPPRRRPSEPMEASPLPDEAPLARPLPSAPPPAAQAPAVPADDAPGLQEAPVEHRTVFDEPEEPKEEEELEFVGDLPIPEPAPQSRDAAPTMLIDEEQLAALLGPPRFALEFKTVRGEKHAVDLKEGENTVGRLAGSEISLDDASISRSHALITVRAGKVVVRDLDSKNGTFVGDKKIAAEIEIKPETPLRFGLVKASLVRKTEKPA